MQIPSIHEIPNWVAGTDLNQLDGFNSPLESGAKLEINTAKWLPFRYDVLFDIERGRGPRKTSLTGDGETPFLTSIEYNNGLTGYTSESPQHAGNVITVNRNGSVGEAFYQPDPFSTTEDVHVFKPKFQLNRFIAMFLTSLIRKEKYRFNYSRKWGLERMNESIIRLPVTSSGDPDWTFMENYIKVLPYSKSI